LTKESDGYWRVPVGASEKTPLPRNLFIIGTVNVDETTYMFSPKVLDRANTFEFRVHTSDLQDDTTPPQPCSAGPTHLLQHLLTAATDESWHLRNPSPEQDTFATHLRTLHRLLSPFGLEFGHRTFREAGRFAAFLYASGERDAMQALDRQVIQKILPRVHGARRRVEPALVALGAFCFDPTSIDVGASREVEPFDPCAPTEAAPRLPVSFDKIRRMTESLRANQFVSFTE
jgi:5-methylcytosine-specific restriction protein B